MELTLEPVDFDGEHAFALMMLDQLEELSIAFCDCARAIRATDSFCRRCFSAPPSVGKPGQQPAQMIGSEDALSLLRKLGNL